MEATGKSEYLQKTYDCVFRHGGNALHTMPLGGVTKHELKLLVFVHGRDSVPPESIRYTGEKQLTMRVRSPEGSERAGQEVEVPVLSEMDEYKRLAKKFEVLSDLDGIGRGVRYVENCFKIRLDDFDDTIFRDVDPIAAIEEAATRAELKTAPVLEEPSDAEGKPAAPPSMGRVFERSRSEGVRP